MDGTDGNDTLIGGPGDDLLRGLGGDDFLSGEPCWSLPCIPPFDRGNDTLIGGDGEDTLIGAFGSNWLEGGAGADTFVIFLGASDTVQDFELGVDRIEVTCDTCNLQVRAVVQDGDTLVQAKFDYSVATFQTVATLIGVEASLDRLLYPENDSLVGGDGDDLLEGGPGNDTLDGGAGNDTLIGDSGYDLLFGGPGDDSLLGGRWADTLDGGPGADTILGGVAPDSAMGGDGDDSIKGGGGRDRLRGNEGDDILQGRSDHDRLWGGKGDDRLNGGKQGDRLHGRNGADTLNGQTGSDWLDGGRGRDELTGGGGPDTFVFSGKWGRDRITDFDPTLDRLIVDTAGEVDSARAFRDACGEAGDDVIYDAGEDGTNVIRLEGLSLADLRATPGSSPRGGASKGCPRSGRWVHWRSSSGAAVETVPMAAVAIPGELSRAPVECPAGAGVGAFAWGRPEGAAEPPSRHVQSPAPRSPSCVRVHASSGRPIPGAHVKARAGVARQEPGGQGLVRLIQGPASRRT